MAAILHAAPAGTRFATGELGAWYASHVFETATHEVVHHLRRELAFSGMKETQSVYRAYSADLAGPFVDIRGGIDLANALYARDDYRASQEFSETVRAGAHSGIVYDSVRDPGGLNVVSYRPSRVLNVRQSFHYRIRIPTVGKIIVERLNFGADLA